MGHSTERVELYERKIPKLEGTALTLMKAVGEVEGATPQDILAFTLEGDLNKRKEFDPDISLLEVLKGKRCRNYVGWRDCLCCTEQLCRYHGHDSADEDALCGAFSRLSSRVCRHAHVGGG